MMKVTGWYYTFILIQIMFLWYLSQQTYILATLIIVDILITVFLYPITSTNEGFYERSLNDYFYCSLCDDPNRFLETFDKFRIYAKPDWYSREDVWVNEQKDFIARIKSIYNSI